jgi:hypothetical protein
MTEYVQVHTNIDSAEVSGVTEPPHRHDVTVTIARDGGYLPAPGEYARRAAQAASTRAASVMSAHTAGQFIHIVTAAGRTRAEADSTGAPAGA